MPIGSGLTSDTPDGAGTGAGRRAFGRREPHHHHHLHFARSSSTLSLAASTTSSIVSAGKRKAQAAAASAQTRLRAKVGEKRTELNRTLEKNANNSVFKAEFWNPGVSRWTTDAIVSVNKNKNRLAIEYNGKDQVRLPLNGLRLEHSSPVSKDFNVIVTSVTNRHRVAFFSEADAIQFLELLRKCGAAVIGLRHLVPAACSTDSIRVKRKSLLRPISEGQALSYEQFLDQTEEGLEDRMRVMDTGRRLYRRKSTGSASDIIKSSGNSNTLGTKSSVSTYSSAYLPRSSSMSIRDRRIKQDDYFDGRGLSTNNTKKKKKKQQSDQSLDSYEISSGGNDSQSDYEESDSNSAASSLDDHHQWDGIMPKRNSIRLPQSKIQRVGAQKASNVNEKLEKFKFMLVGIEEDEDMLDPGQFGIHGEYVPVSMNDFYPIDDDLTSTPMDQAGQALVDAPKWIRKSMEELELDFTSTVHENIRRSSVITGSSKTQQNMLSNVGSLPRGLRMSFDDHCDKPVSRGRQEKNSSPSWDIKQHLFQDQGTAV